MTNLEKVLSVGLISVTTFSAFVVMQSIKRIKRDQQFLESIQERCEDIGIVLNDCIEESE